MIKDHDYLIKLILVGSSGVGKTSILTQFADNKFSENYLTTIGVDFRFKTIKIDDKNVKFQIWDTAGQQRFRTITSAYYKGADGILMVYDVTDPSTLEDIEQFWIPQAYNYCDRSIDVILLGNKSDCPSLIVPSKLDEIVSKNNFTHERVSAKNDEKIYESIRDLGIRIIKKKDARKTQVGQMETSTQSNSGGSTQTPKTQAKVEIGKKKQYDLKYSKKCC